MNGIKPIQPSIFRVLVLILLAASALSGGCALIKAKKDIDKSMATTVVVGRVTAPFQADGPIIVAACSPGADRRIAHYTVLHEAGEYELMVEPGDYHVFAFLDKNSNLVYEPGEPAAQYGGTKQVHVPKVGVVFDIDIAIAQDGRAMAIPYGLQIDSIHRRPLRSRQAGVVTDLDDDRFLPENGVSGFWKPISFFREFGGNIYFLEKYDPEKIPILFIHGAAGTPSGWRHIVATIDRSRFQPWFFYYPSGARLESMSYLLLWKLSNLQAKYHFNRICITAHSMGGLVARSFIVNYGRQFPCVKLFISLATPWGGDKMAEYGVKQSPVVIPSWIDMQPESDFIESLYRMKMPGSVRFYMFCGHRGSQNPFRSYNDGTIALSSLFDYRPQSEAEMNYTFNEDHASILTSQAVFDQYNAIINAFDAKQQNAGSGGYIRIHFAYADGFSGKRPDHRFILRPDGGSTAETVTFLTDADNHKVLGPFPRGDYLASMVTMAAKPLRNRIPVTIEAGRTNDLKFVLAPDGVIRGCVAAELKKADQSIGMPDYTYRSSDSDVDIESIILEGRGIYRELRPEDPRRVHIDDYLNYNYLISRADFCIQTCFGFFGLPAGSYQLTLNARGYQPIEKKYIVSPGALQYFRVTELTPNRP